MLTDLVKQLAKEHGYKVQEIKPSDIIELGDFGNIWIRRQTYDKAGQSHHGHKHDHDHVTLVVQGKALIEKEGYEPQIVEAEDWTYIQANVHHEIIALEDNTHIFCLFAMRDMETDEVVDVKRKWERRLSVV